MRPPSLLVLQAASGLVGFSAYLAAMVANAVWSAHGWPLTRIGLAVAATNLCYGAVVGIAGALVERIGRARSCIVGASIGAVGCAIAAATPTTGTALVAAMASFLAMALYFPGVAGLYSDGTSRPMPLHAKVSFYSLGWGLGVLVGFVSYGALARTPPIGFAIAALGFVAMGALLWRWRRASAAPPAADGDRASHPTLGRLTMLYRCSVLLTAMVAATTSALAQRILTPLSTDAPALCATLLAAHSVGSLTMFALMGRWDGWILRPGRAWWLQAPIALGGALLLVVAHAQAAPPVALIAVGLLTGLGHGATYMASIYCSMRLPDGAARGAGVHEAFLGVGYVVGPPAAALLISAAIGDAAAGWPALAGLGWWIVGLAAVVLALPVLAVRRR
ncbi:MAG TPA: MFS transporter [Planctomycetota bacterium]|nr:MFS transporter [Planctomycetota bacterium]